MGWGQFHFHIVRAIFIPPLNRKRGPTAHQTLVEIPSIAGHIPSDLMSITDIVHHYILATRLHETSKSATMMPAHEPIVFRI